MIVSVDRRHLRKFIILDFKNILGVDGKFHNIIKVFYRKLSVIIS